MAKVSDLLTHFYNLINEVYDSDPKVTVVINWYNECLDDVAEEAALDGTPQSFSTVAATAAYAVAGTSGDFIRYRELKCGSNWLEPTSIDDLARHDLDQTKTGTPTHYYLYSGQVYLWPVPDRVFAVTGWWVRRPTQLSAADTGVTPELPPRFHTLLNDYALYRYQVRDFEPDLANAAWAQYARQKAALGTFRTREVRRGRPAIKARPFI